MSCKCVTVMSKNLFDTWSHTYLLSNDFKVANHFINQNERKCSRQTNEKSRNPLLSTIPKYVPSLHAKKHLDCSFQEFWYKLKSNFMSAISTFSLSFTRQCSKKMWGELMSPLNDLSLSTNNLPGMFTQSGMQVWTQVGTTYLSRLW